jgi:hypothetical protein
VDAISAIRLPDFVTKEDFDWAVKETAQGACKEITSLHFLG